MGSLVFLRAYLDSNRSRNGIANESPDVSGEVIDALLLSWLHKRWICRVEDRYVVVLPRKGRREPLHGPRSADPDRCGCRWCRAR